MIKLEAVAKTFPPERIILKNISLNLEKGGWIWLLGDTGVGKSVLLKITYGVEVPTEGSVQVLGQDVPNLGEKELARLRRRIGIVFQDIRLFEDRSARDNIAQVLRALGMRYQDAVDKAQHWLDRIGMGEYSSRCPFELSIGQRQKVALARALAKEPELMLLDEPFSALDEKETREMLKILGEVNHKGTTIFAVSHEHEVLHFLPGRILSLTPEGIR
ncbi:ATP-binding cassette domain-containing protein [candidate division WOR-3 bacterium]|nr:ATP-binding cassette domain-containing protein [candidate division WOR-3 bacterium]